MSNTRSFDVVIVGAGMAGCHVAARLASHHLNVARVDQKPLATAGPHWINAVPSWMFDHADLTHPHGKELFDLNDRFIIRAPDKKTRLVLNNLNVPDVHMGHLGKRLKQTFLEAPQAHEIVATIIGVDVNSSGRVTKVHGVSPQGASVTLVARLFVDASGLSAVVRKLYPRTNRLWPVVLNRDLCTAAQRTLAIGDREGALTFLEQNRIKPGDVLSDVGCAGGFSLFRTQVSHDLSQVSLLAGVGCNPRFASANRLVESWVNENPWATDTLIDGRGAIPLNAPYRRLFAPGLALLGDAGSQVYAAHGSGIGFGLIAARILADSIVQAHENHRDVGAPETLLAYQQAFHRRYYQRLYFSQQFRKFSQSLNEAQTTRMLASEIIGEELAKQTLRQENPSLEGPILTKLLRRALMAPRVFSALVPVFSSSILGRAHAARLSTSNTSLSDGI